MARSVFTPNYKAFLETIVAIRKEQDVTQVELARRLGVPQQYVSRVELGIRRLDVVEFCELMEALKIKPMDGFGRFICALSEG